jgi:hypothetical protein
MHSLKNPSQFLTDPGMAVVHALNRIGRYLLGTMNEGLRLYGNKGEMQMQVASDADDAGGQHRRSMLCYMAWIGPPLGDESKFVPRAFFLYTNHWSIVVASGSMESEIYAIHAATKGTTHIRGLLGEIGLHDGSATKLAVDSSSSKTVLQGEHSEKISTGVKHIDRRMMSIKQQISANIYELMWVSRKDNPPDIGATFKSKTEYERLRKMIMGYDFPRYGSGYMRDTEEPSHWSKTNNSKTNPLPANKVGESE